MMRRLPIVALLVAGLALEAGAQSRSAAAYYPPKDQWEHRTPAQLGLDAALIDSAVAFAKTQETSAPRDQLVAHDQSGFGREPLPSPIGPMKTRGDMTGIIVKSGYIVAEWGEPDRVDMTHSVT